MAKKKRRKKSKKKERGANTKRIDSHHLCWQRRMWRNGAVRELRSHPYCIVDMPKYTLHRYIHAKMSGIPVPKSINAKGALFQLELLERFGGISDNDSIENKPRLYASLISPPSGGLFSLGVIL